jgi:dipeptidyl aminopeptidase/acylaminoacyl peptidase
VPKSLLPTFLALAAVSLTLVAWAAFAARTTSTDSRPLLGPEINPQLLRSVAYTVPGAFRDAVYVRSIAPGAAPRQIAAFDHVLDLHARGLASPPGDVIAVLSVSNFPATAARLTLLDARTGARREVEGEFAYLSALAWSADGARLAGVRHSLPRESGLVDVSVLEVEASSGGVSTAGMFEGVLEAAPVGYTPDGAGLYVVVVDPSGSRLWLVSEGRQREVAELSAGRTRDWSMSPDGARLAYVDIRASSHGRYAGRTLLIASGAIAEQPAAGGDQVGVAWAPGAETPDFGGPGGSLQLEGTGAGSDYVVPVRWSADGKTLLARVTAGADRAVAPSDAFELTTPNSRIRLVEQAGAAVFGFVRNTD